MLSVSVIILTYNSASYIEKLLQSLISRYLENLDKELEIIVADNSSSDDTLKIAKKFEKIKILHNGGNLGFAKGINAASKTARGDVLIFINPDAIFESGDLFEMASKLSGDVVVVGGKMLAVNKGEDLSCGKFYTLVNTFMLALGLEEKLKIRFSPSYERLVDYVSGGFMAVKREEWEKLGGFDESFFMYVEDMEFCYRVKKRKLKVLFSPSATIAHIGQGSSNRTFAVVNIYKGIIYFHKKHLGKLSSIIVRLILGIKAIILVILGRISNNKYLYTTYAQALSQI